MPASLTPTLIRPLKSKNLRSTGAKGDLPIYTDEQRLNVLGPGVILMFLFKRAAVANLIMAILIYGIFALVSNLLGFNIKNFPDDYLTSPSRTCT